MKDKSVFNEELFGRLKRIEIRIERLRAHMLLDKVERTFEDFKIRFLEMTFLLFVIVTSWKLIEEIIATNYPLKIFLEVNLFLVWGIMYLLIKLVLSKTERKYKERKKDWENSSKNFDKVCDLKNILK